MDDDLAAAFVLNLPDLVIDVADESKKGRARKVGESFQSLRQWH